MGRFPGDEYIGVIVQELPALIARQPDWAGEFLVSIANGQGGHWDYHIKFFNEDVAAAPPAARQAIVDYIRSQEESGWLTHRVGVLCPDGGADKKSR